MCINHTSKTDATWRRAIALGLTADVNTALRRMATSSLFDRNVIDIIAGYMEPRKLRLEKEANIAEALITDDYVFIFTHEDQLKKYSLLTGKMLARLFRPYGMMCTDGTKLFICDGLYLYTYTLDLHLISKLDAPGVALVVGRMYYFACHIVFVDPDGITKFNPRTGQTEKIDFNNVGYFGNEFALYLIKSDGNVTRYDGNSTRKVDIDRAHSWDMAYGNNHIMCAWILSVYRIFCSSDHKNVCGSLTINGYGPHRLFIGGRRIIVVIASDTFIFDNPFPAIWQ